MRPSYMLSAVLGIIIFLAGMAFGIYAFFSNEGGKPWFFWIAPLLCLGFGLIMIQLVVMYWLKVGRLEMRGRPRSD